MKRVIAWAKSHADGHGSTRARSSSAAAGWGAPHGHGRPHGQRPAVQPGFETSDTSLAGAVGFYGDYGALRDDERPAPTTPLAYDAASAPPVLVVHGDNDTYTPVQGARALVEHLRATSGNPVVLAELAGAQHAFDLFHSVRYEAVVDAVDGFAAWVRSTTPAHPGGRTVTDRAH